jgi:myotubularin-related protein 6/7/8
MGLSSQWRISTINQEYQFCPTYPRLLIVPQRISDNTLRHIGKFRSKARIPALSYFHRNQCTITRSAQPMVGLKQNKNIQDEKLVEAIFDTTKCIGKKECLILDARPLTNAMAQTAMGAGTESKSEYKNCDIMFLGIENIHVVRDSFTKLYDGIFA